MSLNNYKPTQSIIESALPKNMRFLAIILVTWKSANLGREGDLKFTCKKMCKSANPNNVYFTLF